MKDIPNIIGNRKNPLFPITESELWEYAQDHAAFYAIDSNGDGHFFEGDMPFHHQQWGMWVQENGGAWYGHKHDMTGVDWRKCFYSREVWKDLQSIIIQ
jgi:hypothetical protein